MAWHTYFSGSEEEVENVQSVQYSDGWTPDTFWTEKLGCASGWVEVI